MDAARKLEQAPGPGTIRFLHQVRTRGFLDAVGDLWHEHGDLFQVRIGPRRMLFAMHPDAVEHVSVKHRERYEKASSYDNVRRFLTGEGLLTSNGDRWRRQRKLLAPFFTPKGVRTYAELMIRDGHQLQRHWQDLAEAGRPVEIAEEMTQVTASIILRAMFSAETPESIRQLKHAVETMVSFVNARLTSVPIPLWIPTERNRRYRAARDLVHGSVTDLIAQRRQTDPSEWPDDLLSRLMTVRDEDTGHPMSESLLRDESITAFFAGHETTARTLTFTWYALAAHPTVADKLHAELDRVLGGQAPTVEALRELPYTLQVVKEVLRLYPAAPFYIRDAVVPDEIDGLPVAAGTGVMLSPYYTHRHPDFWEDPQTFDPDRWAPGRETPSHAHAYHPFAAGPRICIGNHFSLLESHLLLAILAQRFAPRLPPDYEPRWEMQGVLNLANGLPMTIEARS